MSTFWKIIPFVIIFVTIYLDIYKESIKPAKRRKKVGEAVVSLFYDSKNNPYKFTFKSKDFVLKVCENFSDTLNRIEYYSVLINGEEVLEVYQTNFNFKKRYYIYDNYFNNKHRITNEVFDIILFANETRLNSRIKEYDNKNNSFFS